MSIGKRIAIAAIVLVAMTSLLWAAVGSQITFTLGTTPGNPGAGKIRLWSNTATGFLECLSSAGANCIGNATSASAVAVGGITGLGTGVGTWLATPSGANLSTALTTPLTSTGGGLGAALNGAAAHSTVISNGASPAVYSAKVIPDCTDTGGNHINFTQSTDAFSCGTSGGGSAIAPTWFFPFGFDGYTNGSNQPISPGARNVTVNAFIPSVATTITKVSFYIKDACGSCGLRIAIWDSARTTIIAQTAALTSQPQSSGAKSVSFSAPASLTAGTLYYLAWTTEDVVVTMFTIGGNAATGLTDAFQSLLLGSAANGVAANNSTGSAGTLAFPATLGSITTAATTIFFAALGN